MWPSPPSPSAGSSGRRAALVLAFGVFALRAVALATDPPQAVDRGDPPLGHRGTRGGDRVERIHAPAAPLAPRPRLPLGGARLPLRAGGGDGGEQLLLAGLDLEHHHAPPEEHRARPGGDVQDDPRDQRAQPCRERGCAWAATGSRPTGSPRARPSPWPVPPSGRRAGARRRSGRRGARPRPPCPSWSSCPSCPSWSSCPSAAWRAPSPRARPALGAPARGPREGPRSSPLRQPRPPSPSRPRRRSARWHSKMNRTSRRRSRSLMFENSTARRP